MKNIFIIVTILLVLGSSCTEFLSVNEKNPNSASAVPANLVLPAALNATANNVIQPDNYSFVYLWYGMMSVSGGYSQPTALTQYKPINSSYQGNWANLYLNLENYDYLEKQATGVKKQPYRAIAKIMKSYIWQILVDIYGNVPYSQALKTKEGILKPKYDDQQSIYESLVVQLDSAMTLLDTTPADAEEIAEYDIVFGGDLDLWWKFANTIKLRMLLNQTGMSGRASYISGALATTAHTTADYLGAGEGAMLNPGYLQSAGKMNPFWENFYKQDGSQQPDGLGYYVANQDACDFLTTNNDPRKLRFFTAMNASNPTSVKGNYFGAIVLEPVPSTSKLGPGMLQAFNQDAPLMTDTESLLLQAEAVERGLIVGDSKALYEEAVAQSIVYMGGTQASAAAYVVQLGKPLANIEESTNRIRTIITQKWVALNGLNPMPVWTDYRRTGYPDFIHWSADPAKLNPTPPVRLLYPQTEINVNNENVIAQGTIDLFTSKIFWQNR